MKQNVASQNIAVQMNSRTDGSPLTTSVSVAVTIDNGTSTAGGGTLAHKANGHWNYIPTQAETNGAHICFQFTHATGVNQVVQVYTNFPQTGDGFARLGAPAGASVSADILAIDNLVDDLESRIGTPSNLGGGATISANLSDIEAQTDDIGAAGAGLTALASAAALATVQADTDDIQSKIGTPSNLGGGATLAANLSDIEAQTDDIGAAGAGLTALATAAALATVQADTDDIQTRLPAALVGGRMDSSVGAMAANVMTAAAAAADLTTELQAGLATAASIAALNNISTAQVNAEVDAALADARLDELLAADSDIDGAAPPAVGSVFHELMTKTAGSFTYDQTTDSLEAARDNIGTNGAALTIAAVTGAVGSVTGAVGSVTGNVGGNVTGSVGSVAADGITAASIATDAIDSDAIAASAVTELQAGLATAAALATVQSDTDNIQTRLPAALVGGRMDSSVGAMAADTLTASALAADAVTEIQAGLATSAALVSEINSVQADIAALNDVSPTEVENAVWDAVLADHLDAGSTGFALNAAGAAGDPWSTALPGAYGAGTAGFIVGTNINATISSRATQATADAIEADTQDIQSKIGTPAGASVSADIAAIEAQTDDIGAAGAGLTAVPWNPAWDAEVQSEVADALAAYDAATATDVSNAQTAIIAQVDANEAKLDIIDANVDQIETIADKLDTTLQADGSVWQFTEAALELGPGGAGSGTDWTSAERSQIRQALGIDGTKVDATGGDLQELLDRPAGGGGGGGSDWNGAQRDQILAAVARIPSMAAALRQLIANPKPSLIVPAAMEAPAEGSREYAVLLYLHGPDGQMASLDDLPILFASTAAGEVRKGRLGRVRPIGPTGVWLATYRVEAGDDEQVRLEAVLPGANGERTFGATFTVSQRPAGALSEDDRQQLAGLGAAQALSAERAEATLCGVVRRLDELPRKNGALAAHVVGSDDLPMGDAARSQLADDVAAASDTVIGPGLARAAAINEQLVCDVADACELVRKDSIAQQTLSRMRAMLGVDGRELSAEIVRHMDRLAKSVTEIEGRPRPGGWATPGDLMQAAGAIARRLDIASEALERVEATAGKLDEILEPDGEGSWRICGEALTESPQAPAAMADDLKAMADDLTAQIRRQARRAK